MTRPTPRRSATPARPDDAAVTFEDLEVIACVYGPGTSDADVERMLPLGPGWGRGIEHWRASDAPYLMLRASTFEGGSRGEPTVVLARDRQAIERAIWEATLHAETRLCMLESFEPSLKAFVRTVIDASHRQPGHA